MRLKLCNIVTDIFRETMIEGDLVMKKYLPSGFVTHPLLLRTTLAGLFLFSAAIASAQSISIVSGNGQLICSQCPTRSFTYDPLVVMVKDGRGVPVPNATVSWT